MFGCYVRIKRLHCMYHEHEQTGQQLRSLLRVSITVFHQLQLVLGGLFLAFDVSVVNTDLPYIRQ
jgi:hypothetical protein